MTPSEIKQLTPDQYGGDFELTAQNLDKHTNNAGQPSKNIRIAQVGAQVGAQVEVQDKVQDEMTMEVGE